MRRWAGRAAAGRGGSASQPPPRDRTGGPLTTRPFGVVALAALLLLATLAAPALGVDEEEEVPPHQDPHHELPSIDEVGTQSETAREFFPEPAEEQPFTEALVFPLMVRVGAYRQHRFQIDARRCNRRPEKLSTLGSAPASPS
jgi:hypothetical protein